MGLRVQLKDTNQDIEDKENKITNTKNEIDSAKNKIDLLKVSYSTIGNILSRVVSPSGGHTSWFLWFKNKFVRTKMRLK